MKKWKNGMRGGNSILKYDDFYISYNPNPSAAPLMEDRATLALMGSLKGMLYGGDCSNSYEETAICVGGSFYILNGDFRKQYQEAAESGGLPACMKVYESNKDEHGSDYSSDAV